MTSVGMGKSSTETRSVITRTQGQLLHQGQYKEVRERTFHFQRTLM